MIRRLMTTLITSTSSPCRIPQGTLLHFFDTRRWAIELDELRRAVAAVDPRRSWSPPGFSAAWSEPTAG